MEQAVIHDYEEAIKIVESLGWAESEPGAHEKCDRNWFRWFSGQPRCQGNLGKRLQIQLRLWDFRPLHSFSFDLCITAEPPGNLGPMELKVYGINDARKIEPNIDRLLAAWKACQKY